MEPLAEFQPQLKAKLGDFLAAKQSKLLIPGDKLPEIINYLEPFVLSGKFIRGSLICYIYQQLANRPPDSLVFRAAMAIELMHSALLIQDDVMDQDDKRRGQPAIHKKYQQFAQQQELDTNVQHFGNSLAMCASDILIFLAFELLAERQNDPRQAKLQSTFTQVLIKVCQGQMQDIYQGAAKNSPDKQTIFDLMQAKTASYTLAWPLIAGAMLSDSPAKICRQLEDFGLAVGTIFQIRDDELGALGNTKKLGKPVGADIREGKKTLLQYYLYRKVSPSELIKIKSIFGNSKAKDADIKYVQQLIKRYGITDLLVKDIDKLQNLAFKIIDRARISETTKEDLRKLTYFCSARQL